jgi:hypothetical protein
VAAYALSARGTDLEASWFAFVRSRDCPGAATILAQKFLEPCDYACTRNASAHLDDISQRELRTMLAFMFDGRGPDPLFRALCVRG